MDMKALYLKLRELRNEQLKLGAAARCKAVNNLKED